jgi:hypothetical protein
LGEAACVYVSRAKIPHRELAKRDVGFQPTQEAWHAAVSQYKLASDPTRNDANFIDMA